MREVRYGFRRLHRVEREPTAIEVVEEHVLFGRGTFFHRLLVDKERLSPAITEGAGVEPIARHREEVHADVDGACVKTKLRVVAETADSERILVERVDVPVAGRIACLADGDVEVYGERA